MKKLIYLLLITASLSACQRETHPLVGLWEITKVEVGEELMTPLAKWVDFRPDGTHRGGNGWVQHSIGTWHYDETQSQLKMVTSNGLEDPYGPFAVQFTKEGMEWQRMEEGMPVKVTAQKISEIPATYADKMIGLWEVEKVLTSGDSLLLFQPDATLFMRMDRRYLIQGEAGRRGGVWHAHGHRQRVRLLSDAGDAEDTGWQVSYEGDAMIWEQEGDPSTSVNFRRIRQF